MFHNNFLILFKSFSQAIYTLTIKLDKNFFKNYSNIYFCRFNLAKSNMSGEKVDVKDVIEPEDFETVPVDGTLYGKECFFLK